MMSNILFITYGDSLEDWIQVKTLEKSLRRFGGEINHSRILVYVTQGEGIPEDFSFLEDVDVRKLNIPAGIRNYIFAAKVTAMAQAEADHPEQSKTLAWIDPSCLILNPPLLYELDDKSQVAFRPVHIRNIGLRVEDPLDDYWRSIYQAAGIEDTSRSIESFADGQRLRVYFNTHAFSIKSGFGFMRCWLEIFTRLVTDSDFQSNCCQDQRHRVFLFQVALSAMITQALPAEGTRILPSTYNYPYNLQAQIPPGKRAASLSDLVSITYEGRSLDPRIVNDIKIPEPYRSFLI